MNNFKESDWKVLRELKEVALDRLCRRILDEVGQEIISRQRTHHDRFLRAYSMMNDGNNKIARAFDGLRRSTAFMQLHVMREQGLITNEELERFSAEVQGKIQAMESRGRLTSARADGANDKEGAR